MKFKTTLSLNKSWITAFCGFFFLIACSPKIISYRVSDGMETVLLDVIDETNGIYLFSHIKTGEVRSFSFLMFDSDSLKPVITADISIREIDKSTSDTTIFYNGKLIEKCRNNDSFFHFENDLACYYIYQNSDSTVSSVFINNLSNDPIFIAQNPIYDSIYFVECSMCLTDNNEVFVPKFSPVYIKNNQSQMYQDDIIEWLILKFYGENPKVLTPYIYSKRKYFKYVSEFKKKIGEDIGVW